MDNLISGYLWAFRNYKSGEKSLRSLRKHYPNVELFINVDHEGDIENYIKVGQSLNATVTVNAFQLGYCGNFGGRDYGYECWSREATFEWLNGVYRACNKTNSKYMILLEEDDFVLKNISILTEDFSMAIHPTDPSPTGRRRPNFIPSEFLDYSLKLGGVGRCPGYAAGGGTIFNTKHFIDSWEKAQPHLYRDYDALRNINKIIGWEDFIFQFVMMIGGYEIIQNHNLCEHWEVPNFNSFEIITGLKDHNLIQL